MNKLTTTLLEINGHSAEIREEIEQAKRNSSAIANMFLERKYPELYVEKKATITNLLNIWNFVVSNASRKFSRSWQKLFGALDTTIKTLYPSENTFESTFTKFRKSLRDERFDPEIYRQSTHILGVSQERSKERKREYSAKVAARNVSRGDLTPIYVEQVLMVIDKLVGSNDPYDKVVAVELATGSRGIEVLKVSNYEEVKGHPNEILVIGLAKDKGQNNLVNVRLVRNLVGLNAEQVIDAVEYIRENINTTGSNDAISGRTNKFINKAFKESFHPVLKENAADTESEAFKKQLASFTSHKARYLAGNMSYLLYGKPRKVPYESWLQSQYGHLSGESTKSYLNLNLKFKNKTIQKGDASELREIFNSDIKRLEGKVDVCCSKPSDSVDVLEYRNSFVIGADPEQKVSNVVEALKEYKRAGIKITQRVLRSKLGYSAAIMSEAYSNAREQGVI